MTPARVLCLTNDGVLVMAGIEAVKEPGFKYFCECGTEATRVVCVIKTDREIVKESEQHFCEACSKKYLAEEASRQWEKFLGFEKTNYFSATERTG